MIQRGVLVGQSTLPALGAHGAVGGAISARPKFEKHPQGGSAAPHFKKVCCKVCAGKGCIGRCKF